MVNSFGEYLKEKRRDRHYTMQLLADLTGKSKAFISQVESGYRLPPGKEALEKLSDALVLNEREKRELFELAEQTRNTLSKEMTDYINSHSEIKEALKISMDLDVPDEEWEKYLQTLKDKFLM